MLGPFTWPIGTRLPHETDQRQSISYGNILTQGQPHIRDISGDVQQQKAGILSCRVSTPRKVRFHSTHLKDEFSKGNRQVAVEGSRKGGGASRAVCQADDLPQGEITDVISVLHDCFRYRQCRVVISTEVVKVSPVFSCDKFPANNGNYKPSLLQSTRNDGMLPSWRRRNTRSSSLEAARPGG